MKTQVKSRKSSVWRRIKYSRHLYWLRMAVYLYRVLRVQENSHMSVRRMKRLKRVEIIVLFEQMPFWNNWICKKSDILFNMLHKDKTVGMFLEAKGSELHQKVQDVLSGYDKNMPLIDVNLEEMAANKIVDEKMADELCEAMRLYFHHQTYS